MSKTRIFKFLFFSTLFLTLTSCLDSTQLSEQAIVEGIGIDMVETQYVITIEYFTPNSSTKETPNTLFVKETSKSISEAIYEINSKIGKKLYFGQNNIIVIGFEAATNNALTILNFFDSEPDTKSSICVVVGKNAEKIITNESNDVHMSKATLEKIIAHSANQGACCEYRLFKILDNAKSNSNSFLLPHLQILDDGYFEVLGSCIFENGKLKTV